MAGIEPAAYGLRKGGAERNAAESRAVSVGAPAAGSGSSRIDADPRDGVMVEPADPVAAQLSAAQLDWLRRHDAPALRGALLAILLQLL
jgi:hypothetical protein